MHDFLNGACVYIFVKFYIRIFLCSTGQGITDIFWPSEGLQFGERQRNRPL